MKRQRLPGPDLLIAALNVLAIVDRRKDHAWPIMRDELNPLREAIDMKCVGCGHSIRQHTAGIDKYGVRGLLCPTLSAGESHG